MQILGMGGGGGQQGGGLFGGLLGGGGGGLLGGAGGMIGSGITSMIMPLVIIGVGVTLVFKLIDKM